LGRTPALTPWPGLLAITAEMGQWLEIMQESLGAAAAGGHQLKRAGATGCVTGGLFSD
jgi:hypothetical protein